MVAACWLIIDNSTPLIFKQNNWTSISKENISTYFNFFISFVHRYMTHFVRVIFNLKKWFRSFAKLSFIIHLYRSFSHCTKVQQNCSFFSNVLKKIVRSVKKNFFFQFRSRSLVFWAFVFKNDNFSFLWIIHFGHPSFVIFLNDALFSSSKKFP